MGDELERHTQWSPLVPGGIQILFLVRLKPPWCVAPETLNLLALWQDFAIYKVYATDLANDLTSELPKKIAHPIPSDKQISQCFRQMDEFVLGCIHSCPWACAVWATDVLHLATPLGVQMLTMLQKVPLGTTWKCIHDQQRHVLILRWPWVGLATDGQVDKEICTCLMRTLLVFPVN